MLFYLSFLKCLGLFFRKILLGTILVISAFLPSFVQANPLLNFFIQRAGRPIQQPNQESQQTTSIEARKKELSLRLDSAKQRELVRRESWQREALWFRKTIEEHREPKKTWMWREEAKTLQLRLGIIQLADTCITLLDKLPSALASRDQSMALVLQSIEMHLQFLERQKNPPSEEEALRRYKSLQNSRNNLKIRYKKAKEALARNAEELREINILSDQNQIALDQVKRTLLQLPSHPTTQSIHPREGSLPTSLPHSLTPAQRRERQRLLAYRHSRHHQQIAHTHERMRFEKLRLEAELLELRLEDETLEREALRLRERSYKAMLDHLNKSLKKLSRKIEGGLLYTRAVLISPEALRDARQRTQMLWKQLRDEHQRSFATLQKQWEIRFALWGWLWLALLLLEGIGFVLLLWGLRRFLTRTLRFFHQHPFDSYTLERGRYLCLLLTEILQKNQGLLILLLAIWLFLWQLGVPPVWWQLLLFYGFLFFLLRALFLVTSRLFSSQPEKRWVIHIITPSANRFRRRLRAVGILTLLYFAIYRLLLHFGFPLLWSDLLFLSYLSLSQIFVLTLLSYRDPLINALPREHFLERVLIVALYRLYPLFYLGAFSLYASYIWGYHNLVRYITRGVFGTILLFILFHHGYWLLWELLLRFFSLNPNEPLSQATSFSSTSEKRQTLRWLRFARLVMAFLAGLGFVAFSLLVWEIPGGLQALPALLYYPLLDVQGRSFTLLSLLSLAALVTLTIWLIHALPQKMQEFVYPMLSLSEGSQYAINALLSYLIILLCTLFSLQIIGVGTGGMLLVLAVLGIGIGFGLQTLASDFLSGMILIFGRPLSVGDYIEVGEYFGRVLKISARSTTIELLNKRHLLLPNTQLLNDRVINWSAGSAYRDKLTVEIAYGTDPATVSKLLIQIAKEHKEVGVKPAPTVRLRELAPNAMLFSLSVTLPSPNARFRIRSELRMEIARRFRDAGIPIALPKREILLEKEAYQALAGTLLPKKDAPPSQDPPTPPLTDSPQK
jgi:small-conductance mechanosensitive channel